MIFIFYNLFIKKKKNASDWKFQRHPFQRGENFGYKRQGVEGLFQRQVTPAVGYPRPPLPTDGPARRQLKHDNSRNRRLVGRRSIGLSLFFLYSRYRKLTIVLYLECHDLADYLNPLKNFRINSKDFITSPGDGSVLLLRKIHKIRSCSFYL